jgi:hypothetical protein
MPKVKISEFDIDPANNTDINNINIAEGCAPSGINNAIRQLMSDLKEFQTGAGGDPFNGAVNGTVGATTPAAGNFTTLGASSTATLNTLSSSGATITGGSINGTTVGASTASTGAFTTLGASGVATFSAGTVSAPAITTTGDTNTGIFFPATDTIAFTDGGAESMRITSVGNLGIGTTNPSEALEISRTTDPKIRFVDVGNLDAKIGIVGSAALGFEVFGSERMRITSAGNVGIGTSSPARTLDVNGAVRVGDGTVVEWGGVSCAINGSSSTNTMIFNTASTERMRISSAGNVGIGTSNASERLVVQSGSILIRNDTDYLKFNNAADSTYWGRISQSSSDIELSNRQAGALKFLTTDTERMRIDSSGNVGIGINDPQSVRLNVVTSGNSVARFFTSSTAGNSDVYINNANNIGKDWLISRRANGECWSYTSGSDPLVFLTNTAERMRITSTGNVGIGTSTPLEKLDVLGIFVATDANRQFVRLRMDSAVARIESSFASGASGAYRPLAFSTSDAERMRIDTSGNVGIGTSSPSSGSNPGTLAVQTGQNFGMSIYRASTNPAQIAFLDNNNSSAVGTDGNSNMVFYNNSRTTERMRIDSSGDLLVGTTSALSVAAKLQVDGGSSSTLSLKTNTGNSYPNFIWNTATSGDNGFLQFATETAFNGRGGIFYNRGSGLVSYFTGSDARLKNNIVDADSSLNKINAIKVRQFDWKETGNHLDYGFIAQELHEVCPQAVVVGGENEKTNPWGIDASHLIPMLTKAIQELNAKVEAQAAEIALLKSK